MKHDNFRFGYTDIDNTRKIIPTLTERVKESLFGLNTDISFRHINFDKGKVIYTVSVPLDSHSAKQFCYQDLLQDIQNYIADVASKGQIANVYLKKGNKIYLNNIAILKYLCCLYMTITDKDRSISPEDYGHIKSTLWKISRLTPCDFYTGQLVDIELFLHQDLAIPQSNLKDLDLDYYSQFVNTVFIQRTKKRLIKETVFKLDEQLRRLEGSHFTNPAIVERMKKTKSKVALELFSHNLYNLSQLYKNPAQYLEYISKLNELVEKYLK